MQKYRNLLAPQTQNRPFFGKERLRAEVGTLNRISVPDLDVEGIEVEFVRDVGVVLLALHAVFREDAAF